MTDARSSGRGSRRWPVPFRATPAPEHDPTEEGVEVSPPKRAAAGTPAVVASHAHGHGPDGPVARPCAPCCGSTSPTASTARAAPGPSPAPRHHAEFCENGAKAVAEEATRRRVDRRRSSPPTRSTSSPAAATTGSASRAGSPSPMLKRAGADHYEPVDLGRGLRPRRPRRCGALGTPDEAVFYTSGRTSNEAAFLYQLFVRGSAPTTSPTARTCATSRAASALTETIGVGKGTVTLDDIHQADLILVVGQNPGTNHPRMLIAARAGQGRRRPHRRRQPAARGRPACSFREPADARGPGGPGTGPGRPLPARSGSTATWPCSRRSTGARCSSRGRRRRAPCSTTTSSPSTPTASTSCAAHLRDLDVGRRARGHRPRPGRDRGGRATWCSAAERIIVCWAMGLTQHRNSVATIREIVNFLLLRGNIGRPGAGAVPGAGPQQRAGRPHDGHLREAAPTPSSTPSAPSSASSRPARHGHDTVDAIRAMRDGEVDVFVAMGGNFVRGHPRHRRHRGGARRAARSPCRCRPSSTAPTRWPATSPLILPCLGRTERDAQPAGDQVVTVEDSMSMVHASRGRLAAGRERPAQRGGHRVRLAQATFAADAPGRPARRRLGRARATTTTASATTSARVVPGFDDFDRPDRPSPAASCCPTRPATSAASPPPPARPTSPSTTSTCCGCRRVACCCRPSAATTSTTPPSTASTTATAASTTAAGSCSCTPTTWPSSGFADGEHRRRRQRVDATATERRAERFRLVAYPTARGSCAAYFPEANVLVPLDSTAETSGTPTSKSVVVRLEPTA